MVTVMRGRDSRGREETGGGGWVREFAASPAVKLNAAPQSFQLWQIHNHTLGGVAASFLIRAL